MEKLIEFLEYNNFKYDKEEENVVVKLSFNHKVLIGYNSAKDYTIKSDYLGNIWLTGMMKLSLRKVFISFLVGLFFLFVMNNIGFLFVTYSPKLEYLVLYQFLIFIYYFIQYEMFKLKFFYWKNQKTD